ncbi:MAG: aldo/keto reductase [Treponema sp.]|jgi:aryl-alcohol dehydrogenase-like predicted oxidoreductase|nr:aldo/keto reductase [Treponema sp.]
MEKRTLGKTGFSIGVFAFGGIVVRDTEQTEADNLVAEAVDRGVNYFDVAPSYGNSQNILGPALKPYRRKVYLACKTERRTKDAVLEELRNSLELLKTDYFDVYQMHAVKPEEVDTILGPGGALEAFVSAKERGLARNIGVTTHFDEVALRLLKSYAFDTLLFPINWACYLKDGLGKAALEEAAARNMGRIAIKGLANRAKEPKEDGYPKCWYRPLFDDPELADMALRFTMQQDVHTAVSPGDARMLRLGLSIVEKYQGKPRPLDGGELAELKRRALAVKNPIFPH